MGIEKIFNGTADELTDIEGETLSEKYDKLRQEKTEGLYKQNSQGAFFAYLTALTAGMLLRKY